MNVFFKELRSYWKNLLFWGAGMVFLIGAGMAKYAALKSSGQSINDLLAQLPQSIQAVFGMTGFDLTKASGYYGVLFMYIALMAAVHAVLIGADIISKEERDRTSEFLFVRPISRVRIINGKILAGLFCLLIFNLVTWASSAYFVNYFNKGPSLAGDIALLMSGLIFLQLIFFFIGTAVAAVSKCPKLSPVMASAVMLIAFILTFLININGYFDNLKYLTPFKYFDAHDLLANGRLDWLFVGLSIMIICIMISITYKAYNTRDLEV